MKKSAFLIAPLLLSICTLSFAASLQSLNKQQVTKLLQDKTMTTVPLVTLNKQLVSNTLSVYLDKQGKLNGQFANKPDNDPQTDQGKWTVKSNGVLCATWDHWNQSNPICVFVYKTSNSVIFINQQSNKFESMALEDNIKDGNQINGTTA